MREGDRRQQSLRTNSTNDKNSPHEERENMDSLDAVSIREDAVAADAPWQGPTPLQRYCKLLCFRTVVMGVSRLQ